LVVNVVHAGSVPSSFSQKRESYDIYDIYDISPPHQRTPIVVGLYDTSYDLSSVTPR
jgi:hypothetical protein